ncbi:MAG: ribonuclease E [Lysobacteraceae bacterium]|nr:MAG: ribonuclease E [Xanthomonadaceae bacterium]
MKRMLINATQPEELRVAIVDGQKLCDLDIEVPSREQKKANVYKGKITRVEPSLEAAFVDYGAERHGFLPMKEIARSCYHPDSGKVDGRPHIKDVLREGQEIVVQVEKEERGNKGAALTTYISLAGRYLVLMPNNPRAGGVSRRIEGEEREAIKQALAAVEVPKGMGLIVRTAGLGREAEELQWDLDYLSQLWQAIESAATSKKAPFLIYQESNLIIRALRDYLRNDIGEILIDDVKTYDDAREFMQQIMPHNLRKLKHYDDSTPLFSRYQIESQIASAYARTVQLPSGGSVVFDHTEALLSIDINSARATKGADIEETALNTNLEAAEEIARQLRVRDLGGLIVVDYIDMSSNKNQREVEERMRRSLKQDRARVQVGRISRFGLLEMSRQRLRPSLGESSNEICPRCNGNGTIRDVESLALSMLRLIEEEVMKEQSGQVLAQAPSEVCNFLLNEKRHVVAGIEQRHRVPVMVIANPHWETPKFAIERVRRADLTVDAPPSYERITAAEPVAVVETATSTRPPAAAPAVPSIVPSQPAPRPVKPTKSAITRLWEWLFGNEEEKSAKKASKKRASEVKTRAKRQATKRSDNRKPSQRGGRKQTNNRSRNNRGPKKPQVDKAKKVNQDTKQEQPNKGPSSETSESKPSKPRRRGRRGGRRNRRGPAQDQARNDSKEARNVTRPAGDPSPGSANDAKQAPTRPAEKPAQHDGAADADRPPQRTRRRPASKKPVDSKQRSNDQTQTKGPETPPQKDAQQSSSVKPEVRKQPETKTEQPKPADSSKPEKPKAETPKPEKPKAEPSKPEKPKAEQSKQPKTEQPKAEQPEKSTAAKASAKAPAEPKLQKVQTKAMPKPPPAADSKPEKPQKAAPKPAAKSSSAPAAVKREQPKLIKVETVRPNKPAAANDATPSATPSKQVKPADKPGSAKEKKTEKPAPAETGSD